MHTTVHDDKYCYPESDVLINKMNIQDKTSLAELEKKITASRLSFDKDDNTKLENIFKKAISPILKYQKKTSFNLQFRNGNEARTIKVKSQGKDLGR